MHNLIPTLTLVTTLTFATLSDAAPRKAPQPRPHLTEIEDICMSLGGIAHTGAIMRDKGLSYFEALQRLRKVAEANPMMPGVWTTWFTMTTEGNLRYTYAHPSVTPLHLRQYTELACITVMEEAQVRPSSAAKDRY